MPARARICKEPQRAGGGYQPALLFLLDMARCSGACTRFMQRRRPLALAQLVLRESDWVLRVTHREPKSVSTSASCLDD